MNTKQLRQKILDLAIRGELVPQDPTDEPASVLLERIRAEKEQLIKDKKLKRDKKDNEPIDEVPFELPEGWEWCRLGDLLINRDGERKPLSSSVRSKQIKKYDYYGATGVIDKVDNYIFDEKLLLVGEDGANLLSKVKPNAFFAEGKYWVNNHAHILDATNKNLLDYVIIVINTISLDNYITGTAQPKLSQENLNKIPIPLPPLAEQYRILQKVEQLLTIVDAIEQLQEQLKALVKQTKNQVLNYAIAGKLTRQDPNDEPAEELLKRIGKTTTTAADTPYEKLPKGWIWCRLGDIGTINPKNKLNDELDVSFIPMPLISDGFSNVHTSEVKKWENIKKGYTHFCNEDIGIAKITPCFENRKSVIFNNLKNGVGAGTTELYILRNNKTLSFNKYIFWFIKTQEFINNGIKAFTGAVGQQRISRDFIENTLIPLPPIAEQHRIVQKIETYFSFLDTIENSL